MNGQTARLNNVVFVDQQPSSHDSHAELVAGLQKPQKTINSKYFYDARGSELFERITRLPEYYPTRVEQTILTQHADEMADYCSRDCVLIEPGSGNSGKVRLLLDTIKPSTYVPLDISADYLYDAAQQLGREFPWLNIQAVCADFGDQWQVSHELPQGKRVIFFPGSTIGNLEPKSAEAFLIRLRQWIGVDGGVLIGVDLHKSEQLLHAAYNDEEGITAQFNLNVLQCVNTLLDANFDVDNFSHRAFYNSEQQRIEMHLVSKNHQTVRVNGDAINFNKGESIHTENSYKYSRESFDALAERAGLTVKCSWLDDRKLFSVHYLAGC